MTAISNVCVLSMVQISTGTECFIFDLVACEKADFADVVTDLADFLQNDRVEKVLHSARNDSHALKLSLE